ncbi:hypothetical protein GL179_21710, partial [Vibrio toranzoniae]|nr:hypothetical protein [Vibrio toranzoniae]
MAKSGSPPNGCGSALTVAAPDRRQAMEYTFLSATVLLVLITDPLG